MTPLVSLNGMSAIRRPICPTSQRRVPFGLRCQPHRALALMNVSRSSSGSVYHKEEQIANLREIYADVMDYGDLEQEKEKLEGERDAVGEKYRQEIEKNARVAQNQDEYKKREAELAEEYNRVDAEAKAVEAEIQKRQSCGRRIEGLIAALETADEDFTESLWGNMVEKVTVFEDRLVFTLTSGEEVRV